MPKNPLHTKLCDSLGIEYPIVAFTHCKDVVAAVINAGGFAVHEVLSSLTLLKKHVWSYAWNHGVWEKPIDVYRVLELNRRIAAFFDKAMYHTARGFEA